MTTLDEHSLDHIERRLNSAEDLLDTLTLGAPHWQLITEALNNSRLLLAEVHRLHAKTSEDRAIFNGVAEQAVPAIAEVERLKAERDQALADLRTAALRRDWLLAESSKLVRSRYFRLVKAEGPDWKVKWSEAPHQAEGEEYEPVLLRLVDPRDSLKMLRETLCVAQSALAHLPYEDPREKSHRNCLGRVINEIDRQRPLGSDGKHGDLHTATCGCEVTP